MTLLLSLFPFSLPRNNSRMKTVKKEPDLCFMRDFQQQYKLEATHLANARRPLPMCSVIYFHFVLPFWIISMVQLKAAAISAKKSQLLALDVWRRGFGACFQGSYCAEGWQELCKRGDTEKKFCKAVFHLCGFGHMWWIVEVLFGWAAWAFSWQLSGSQHFRAGDWIIEGFVFQPFFLMYLIRSGTDDCL